MSQTKKLQIVKSGRHGCTRSVFYLIFDIYFLFDVIKKHVIIFSGKRARLETVPVTSDLTGREFRVQKSTGFGQLIAGEAITIRSNLPKRRRDVAMAAREFSASDICLHQHMGGLKALPWGLEVEISGSQMLSDHKYISVRFGLNLSEEPSKIVVGETPVEIKIGLRKGHFILNNKSSLGLTYGDWKNLLFHGRLLVTALRGLEEQSFDSFEHVELPTPVVIRETLADGFEQRQTTIVLLTVSLAKKINSDTCSPIINIREYAEDTKNDCFVATQKGVGLGLKAMYMMMYPVAEATQKLHDIFLAVKVGVDGFFEEAQKQYTAIKNTLTAEGGAWKQIPDKDDELTKDQRRIVGAENALNDDLHEDLDIIPLGELESDALASVS